MGSARQLYESFDFYTQGGAWEGGRGRRTMTKDVDQFSATPMDPAAVLA